jgi:hypothetical protein
MVPLWTTFGVPNLFLIVDALRESTRTNYEPELRIESILGMKRPTIDMATLIELDSPTKPSSTQLDHI